MAGQIDANAWNHLSPEGRKCSTIREDIEARSERRRKYRAADPGTVRRAARTQKSESSYRPFELLYAAIGEVTSAESLRERFPRLIPRRPYCTDTFPGPIFKRSAEVALQSRNIQLNGPGVQVWMAFDVDHDNAAEAWKGAVAPSFVAVNPDNGHAHIGYLLKVPLLKYARRGPLAFAADMESRLRLRLGADPNYSGLLTKNPLHGDWRVDWIAQQPYLLGDLAKAITPSGIFARNQCPSLATGLGRNVAVFDEVRHWSYREIMRFKRHGGTSEAWTKLCVDYAHECNDQLSRPLHFSEVRSIAKSVSKWTWRRFDDAKFSNLQSARSRRRWQGHTPEPWKACGVSRATYYRRKQASSR